MFQAMKSGRLPALDFWRGAYLLMIYINHVPDNPLSFVTLRNWGFADSAEVFVFISGFAAALAFGPFFDKGGFLVGTIRTVKRLWQLLCAHVLLVFAMCAIIVVASDFVDGKQIIEQFNFTPFFVETEIAVVRLLRLGYMPNMTDILPMYIALVALFPLFWVMARFSGLLAAACSLLLWGWVNAADIRIPAYPEGALWFFNPLAWQILFVAGMLAALNRDKLTLWFGDKWVVRAGLIVLGGSFLLLAPWAHLPGMQDWRFVSATWLESIDDKMNLSVVRLVHFVAMAVVGTHIVRGRDAFWRLRAVQIISLCGRHALPVFCVGVALSLIMHILLMLTPSSPFWASLLVLSGAAVLCVFAAALDVCQALLKKAATTTAQAKAQEGVQPQVQIG